MSKHIQPISHYPLHDRIKTLPPIKGGHSFIDECTNTWGALTPFIIVYVLPLYTTSQGCRKQSPDGQVQLDVGNVLSLMEIDVGGEGANNKRAKRAAKIWTLVFLAVRRRSQHQTHETGILRSGSCKSYACVLRYVPCRILLQQFKITQISYAYLCLNFGLEW